MALPTVNNLELFDITHSTMRVRWKAVAGASGYMILYAPLTEEDASDEKEVRSELVCNESKCEAKNELYDAEQGAPCWAPAPFPKQCFLRFLYITQRSSQAYFKLWSK